jgi:capsular polysaccharide export protein
MKGLFRGTPCLSEFVSIADIERRLGSPGDELSDPALLLRAERAMATMREWGITADNDSPPGVAAFPGPKQRRVLVIDEVMRPDKPAEQFRNMLDSALDDNGGAEVWVKPHPDVLAGRARGYLAPHPRVHALHHAADARSLFKNVERVYTVTSLIGLEALIYGVPVVCFGAPFYAGWGVTLDHGPVPPRPRKRSLVEIFAAACILGSRYKNPDNPSEEASFETVIDHLALQRRHFEKNQGELFCFGFQFWKRNYIRAYLRCPGNTIHFCRSAAHARRLGFSSTSRMVAWATRMSPDVSLLSVKSQVPMWRMEDGFLRSVGLGSNLAMPASLVMDRQGIYFDPRTPSELETILQSVAFTGDELARAEKLRTEIVRQGVSKYNVGQSIALSIPAGKKAILVPGQVEDDASVQLGCPAIRKNSELVLAARQAAPDAFLIYKPHPDVASGNREGTLSEEARSVCDHIEESASLADCLAACDEVHTLTSLVGFEALLRGHRVVVYGQPFYAGWGLTIDREPITRRTRRLTLDELVAGTLIRYPVYLNRSSGRFTTPEAVITDLRREREQNPGARVVRLSWARRQLRRLSQAYRGVTHVP